MRNLECRCFCSHVHDPPGIRVDHSPPHQHSAVKLCSLVLYILKNVTNKCWLWGFDRFSMQTPLQLAVTKMTNNTNDETQYNLFLVQRNYRSRHHECSSVTMVMQGRPVRRIPALASHAGSAEQLRVGGNSFLQVV